MEEKTPIQEVWEDFDYKYMQPIFLKELISDGRALRKPNPFTQEEEEKDEEETPSLTSPNIFDEKHKALKKGQRRDSYSAKEIEMKSIIFN